MWADKKDSNESKKKKIRSHYIVLEKIFISVRSINENGGINAFESHTEKRISNTQANKQTLFFSRFHGYKIVLLHADTGNRTHTHISDEVVCLANGVLLCLRIDTKIDNIQTFFSAHPT